MLAMIGLSYTRIPKDMMMMAMSSIVKMKMNMWRWKRQIAILIMIFELKVKTYRQLYMLDADHLEILMPLTGASELEKHPALSIPYKSQVLNDMVQNACSMLHKERKTLAEFKTLLTTFRGDHTFIPSGTIYDESDIDFFNINIDPEDVEKIQYMDSKLSITNKDSPLPSKALLRLDTNEPGQIDVEKEGENEKQEPTHEPNSEAPPIEIITTQPGETGDTPNQDSNQTPMDLDNATPENDTTPTSPKPRSRMLTRHQARTGASTLSAPSLSRTHSRESLLSTTAASITRTLAPLFHIPPKAQPDRNAGLPDQEAEEVRRVLTAVVQKQEEVVRGTAQLYNGLLRAKRLKETVWRWCRAEGHLDEMSDGEDWVDLEEWRLDVPLKKGQEEGVEEVAEKRARGRRVGQ
jgi:hypothetical protein